VEKYLILVRKKEKHSQITAIRVLIWLKGEYEIMVRY